LASPLFFSFSFPTAEYIKDIIDLSKVKLLSFSFFFFSWRAGPSEKGLTLGFYLSASPFLFMIKGIGKEIKFTESAPFPLFWGRYRKMEEE